MGLRLRSFSLLAILNSIRSHGAHHTRYQAKKILRAIEEERNKPPAGSVADDGSLQYIVQLEQQNAKIREKCAQLEADIQAFQAAQAPPPEPVYQAPAPPPEPVYQAPAPPPYYQQQQPPPPQSHHHHERQGPGVVGGAARGALGGAAKGAIMGAILPGMDAGDGAAAGAAVGAFSGGLRGIGNRRRRRFG